jgi:colicin import membrane protein
MSQQQKLGNHFLFSIIFHSVILLALIMGLDFNSPPPVLENTKDAPVLNAVVLDQPPSPAPTPKIIAEPPKPLPQPKPKLEPTPEPPKPKVVEPKPTPKTIALPDPRKKQQELEKQFLADIKKQTEKQKKLKQKEIQHAFEKEIKNQAEKLLQQQLLQEKNRLSQLQSQKTRGEVDKYKALITNAISMHWLVPPTVNKKLKVELLIRLAPGGMVLDVQIAKSSGDVGLDRSARTAVFKASPLPVPSDAESFATFRQFILQASPKDVLRQDAGLN